MADININLIRSLLKLFNVSLNDQLINDVESALTPLLTSFANSRVLSVYCNLPNAVTYLGLRSLDLFLSTVHDGNSNFDRSALHKTISTIVLTAAFTYGHENLSNLFGDKKYDRFVYSFTTLSCCIFSLGYAYSKYCATKLFHKADAAHQNSVALKDKTV